MKRKRTGFTVFIISFLLFSFFVYLFQNYSWRSLNVSRQKVNLLKYAGDLYQSRLGNYQDLWASIVEDGLWDQLQEKSQQDQDFILDTISLLFSDGLVYMVSKDGTVSAASREGRSMGLIGTDLSFRPYVQEGLLGKSAVQSALGVVTGRLGIYFAEPLRDLAGDIAGVMVLKVQAARLLTSVEGVNGETLWIADEKGIIMSSNDQSIILKSWPPLSPTERLNLRNSRKYLDSPISPLPISRHGDWMLWSGSKGILTSVDLSVPGWTLNSFRPQHHFEPLLESQKMLLMAFLLLGFFLCLTISFLVMDIQRRIMVEKELETIAHTDPLTGLLNRRYCLSKLKSMINRAKRGQLNFTICFVDINHLKLVNDEFGHAQGDKYIQTVCQVIDQEIRSTDIFCRMGGDEFLVIHPRAGEKDARDIWQRITTSLERESEQANLHKYSLSYGIVEYGSASTQSPQEIVEMADKMMYKNKMHYKQEKTGSVEAFLK